MQALLNRAAIEVRRHIPLNSATQLQQAIVVRGLTRATKELGTSMDVGPTTR